MCFPPPGEATSIELTGAATDSKAIFVPVREDCRSAVPSVSVSNGKGLFTITGGDRVLGFSGLFVRRSHLSSSPKLSF